jgi:hypothetical protein
VSRRGADSKVLGALKPVSMAAPAARLDIGIPLPLVMTDAREITTPRAARPSR